MWLFCCSLFSPPEGDLWQPSRFFFSQKKKKSSLNCVLVAPEECEMPGGDPGLMPCGKGPGSRRLLNLSLSLFPTHLQVHSGNASVVLMLNKESYRSDKQKNVLVLEVWQ